MSLVRRFNARQPASLVTVVVMAGCAQHGALARPPVLEPAMAQAAESLAGFDLSCEPEELSLQAFAERRSFDEQVVLVGAAGCGRRSYYEVRCAGPACWATPLTSVRSLEER